MIVDCISDLHGHYPRLLGGDVLIVAGDLTATGTKVEYAQFADWYLDQDYTKKVLIAGNHENKIQNGEYYFNHDWLSYLCDSGTEFDGIKIWGTPWTSQFPGINPDCCAFTRPYGKSLMDIWNKIPNDTDILVTHSPPFGIFDKTDKGKNVGNMNLLNTLDVRLKPKLHVFGHIHEQGGQKMIFKRPGIGNENNTVMVNCSHVDEKYRPTHACVRVIIS